MRPRTSTALVSLAFLACGSVQSASAQPADWEGRARVSINGGLQPLSSSFSGSMTNLVNLENAVTTTGYKVASSRMFDGGLAVRLVRNFGVGVAISSSSGKQDATVSATLPHPFFFNTPRTINGAAPGLQRSELATHVQAIYVISTGGKVDVAVMGGPSFFSAKQNVVSNTTYTEVYPYDTATFVSASTSSVSKSAVGFNVGADVGVKLARHVGVGALVRFSRASLEFGIPSHTETVKSDTGGAQVGGGVRFFF